jgi:hypothetical protein
LQTQKTAGKNRFCNSFASPVSANLHFLIFLFFQI